MSLSFSEQPPSNLRRGTRACPNFARILLERALSSPEQRAYVFLDDAGPDGDTSLSYAELERRARGLGARLRELAEPGARALLLYPPGLGFVEAFFGCLYAGLVPVPLYPPRPNRHAERVYGVVADAGAALVLGPGATLDGLVLDGHGTLPAPRALATDRIELTGSGADPVELSADAVAFLQYTSGSTGQPKGVMVSHANLRANTKALESVVGTSPQHAMVSWLPTFHDMGLVGGVLLPMFSGYPSVLMSPSAFIRKPLRWLQAISRYRATVSPAPNFAFELCTKAAASADLSGLDLSTWRVAANGGEPVRAETLERFSAIFGSVGFQSGTHYPCFGMAEGTLLLSGGRNGAGATLLDVDAAALERGQAQPAHGDSSRRLVSSGRAIGGTCAIVDPETCQRLAANQVGELWFSGPSVALGYWNRPAETSACFAAQIAGEPARYLRTGDLGFLDARGELFVTGRSKDMLIVRGRNLYPQDVEAALERAQGAARPNSCAVFGLERGGEEVLGAVIEASRAQASALSGAARDPSSPAAHEVRSLLARLQDAVAEHFSVALHGVAFVKPGSFPRTSSGKLRRASCRAGFESGALEALYTWSTDAGASSPAPSSEPHSGAQPTPIRPAAHDDSAAVADRLIAWFRDYAERRLSSVLMDERRSVAPHVVLELGRRGLFGMTVPRAYGGLELAHRDRFRVIEQVAAVDMTLALMLGSHGGLGVKPLVEHGSEALKARLLPELAAGRCLAAFALSEEGAGSDPRAIRTRAVRVPGGWRVSGEKWWSGLAGWSSVIVVACNAEDEHGAALGSVLLALDTDAAGVQIGPEAPTLGVRAIVQNAVRFEQAFAADEQQLGEVGAGLGTALDTLGYTRLGLTALAIGGMKRCAQLMQRYASRRSIAGRRLSESPLTRARISDAMAASRAHEALLGCCAALLDAGAALPPELSLACKISAPECLGTVADQALQLLGGRGYLDSNPLSQLFRDARLMRIFEGPTEALAPHLGALATSRGELGELLATRLAAPELAREVAELAAELQREAAGGPSDATELARHHIGLHAAAVLLLAATRQQRAEPGALASATQRWARQRVDALAAAAREALAPQNAPPERTTVEQAAAGLAADIGDIDQSLPGLGWQPDPLLRREPTREREPLPRQVRLQQIPAREAATTGAFTTREAARAATEPVASAPAVLPVASPAGEASTLPRLQLTLLTWMRQELKRSVDTFDPDTSFAALGVDSLGAVSLSAALEREIERPVRPELLHELGNLRALAAHIDAGHLGPRRKQATPAGTGQVLEAPPPAAPATPGRAAASAQPALPVARELPRRLERYVGRNERVDALKRAGRYFYETPIEAQNEAWVTVEGRRMLMLMLASYSYLGLVNHPEVNRAAHAAIEGYGCGHHGTRLLGGTLSLHRQVERHFAAVLQADDALIFSSGFGANAATIAALVGQGDYLIGDAWNHASIVDGCQLSGAEFVTFPHADLDALDRLLAQRRGRHTLVVVDSVFSMDGDVVDLPRVVQLCRQHEALLMVDEAHSLGVLGARGRGIQEYFGLPADAIDVKMATLSKALPSCGGVVAGRQELVDFLRHNARGYVFSGAVPAASLAAADAGLRVLDAEPERVQRLWRNVSRYTSGVKGLGFDTLRTCTPIIPLVCKDEAQTMDMTRRCRERGLFVVPVIFPAVPVSSPRLRTCVMASHTDADIDFALQVLADAGRETGLIIPG